MSLSSTTILPRLVSFALIPAGPAGAFDEAGEDSGFSVAGGDDSGASVDGGDASGPDADGWAKPPDDGTALCLLPQPVPTRPRLMASTQAAVTPLRIVSLLSHGDVEGTSRLTTWSAGMPRVRRWRERLTCLSRPSPRVPPRCAPCPSVV